MHHSHSDFQFDNPQVVFGIDPNAPISICGNHLCPYIPHFSSFSRKINLDTFQRFHLPFSLTCPSSGIAITIIYSSCLSCQLSQNPVSWSQFHGLFKHLSSTKVCSRHFQARFQDMVIPHFISLKPTLYCHISMDRLNHCVIVSDMNLQYGYTWGQPATSRFFAFT